jgi:hypothetical protein
MLNFSEFNESIMTGIFSYSVIVYREAELLEYRGAIIKGDFDISPLSATQYGQELEELENMPREVWMNFNCSNLSLKTLKNSPAVVKGLYICSDNQLESLEGLPLNLTALICNDNPGLESFFNTLKIDYSKEIYGNDLNLIYLALRQLQKTPSNLEDIRGAIAGARFNF